MYESFYHLREKPFTLLPDPGFLYMSDKHSMALTLLEYSLMNHTGFTVISGEIGTGKTTLIRHVLNHMDRDHTVGLISTTHRSFGELLQWILLAFNLDHANMSKVEMYQCFVNFIIDQYAHNRSTILIVDEAQNLSVEVLEELRMLSNINADKDQALQIILVGQRELRETLQRPELAQFAQRISVDFHLQPLSEDETITYIRHRLHTAGGDPDIFDLPACQAVYQYSSGVPRLINVLCDTALVYGYAEQKQRIDARLVADVAHEKQQGGIFPTFGPAAQKTELTAAAMGNEAAPEEGRETGAEALSDFHDQTPAHGFTTDEEHNTPAAAAEEIELTAAATGTEAALAEGRETGAEALSDFHDQTPAHGFTTDEEHHLPAAAAEEIELPAAATGSETAPAEGRETGAETLSDFHDQTPAHGFTTDEEHHTLTAAAEEIELTAAATTGEAAPAEGRETGAEALSDLYDQTPAHGFTTDDEHHTPAAAAEEIELTAVATGSETAVPAEGPEVQADSLTEFEDQLAANSFTLDEEHHTLATAADEIELMTAATGSETAPAEGPEVQADSLTEFEDQLAADSFTMDDEGQPAEELDSFDTSPANDMLHEGQPDPDTHSEIDFGPVVAELLVDDKTYRSEHRAARRKVRLALCSAHEGLRKYLSKMLENNGIDVVISTPLDLQNITTIDPEKFDVLLIDRGENTQAYSPDLENILDQWPGPLIYNNTQAMKTALRQRKYEFGKSLAKRIEVIAEASGARLDT